MIICLIEFETLPGMESEQQKWLADLMPNYRCLRSVSETGRGLARCSAGLPYDGMPLIKIWKNTNCKVW